MGELAPAAASVFTKNASGRMISKFVRIDSVWMSCNKTSCFF